MSKISEVDFLKKIINIQDEGCFGKHLHTIIGSRISELEGVKSVIVNPIIAVPVEVKPTVQEVAPVIKQEVKIPAPIEVKNQEVKIAPKKMGKK